MNGHFHNGPGVDRARMWVVRRWRLVFFFLLTRRSPRSTLFPYTTLFRSHARDPAGAGRPPVERRHRHLREGAGDRKSTRLNSSHSQISYAVFCLKKKSLAATTRLQSMICGLPTLDWTLHFDRLRLVSRSV